MRQCRKGGGSIKQLTNEDRCHAHRGPAQKANRYERHTNNAAGTLTSVGMSVERSEITDTSLASNAGTWRLTLAPGGTLTVQLDTIQLATATYAVTATGS